MITQLARDTSDPLGISRLEIFRTLLHLAANILVKLVMARSPGKAALLHNFLHESVDFMIDLCRLQYGICAGGSLHDFSVIKVRTVLALLMYLRFLPVDWSNCFSTSLQIQIGFFRHPGRHGSPRHCNRLWWA